VTQRKQCLALLFEQSPLYLTREQFDKTLDGWDFDIVEANGAISMVFVSKGPEFHFAKFDDTPASRGHLKKYPGSLIEKYGYAVTHTPKTDARQQRFNERLGFYKTGEDEYDIHYRIDSLRRRSCP